MTHMRTRRAWFGEAAPEVLASLAAGRVKIPIAARFPLMEAAGAHELLEQRKVTGKIILEV